MTGLFSNGCIKTGDSLSENGRLIQDFPGIHRLVKLTMNESFLGVVLLISVSRSSVTRQQGILTKDGYIIVHCLTVHLQDVKNT